MEVFMILKKFTIYILLSIFIISVLLQFNVYAFDDTSIYVWSNSSSDIDTSITPKEETTSNDNLQTQENLEVPYLWIKVLELFYMNTILTNN